MKYPDTYLCSENFTIIFPCFGNFEVCGPTRYNRRQYDVPRLSNDFVHFPILLLFAAKLKLLRLSASGLGIPASGKMKLEAPAAATASGLSSRRTTNDTSFLFYLISCMKMEVICHYDEGRDDSIHLEMSVGTR